MGAMGGLPLCQSQGQGPGNTPGRGSYLGSASPAMARGAIAKKAFLPSGPYEPLPTLPIFTDFYRFLPIFTDFSDFLGKTIGNIGNIS